MTMVIMTTSRGERKQVCSASLLQKHLERFCLYPSM